MRRRVSATWCSTRMAGWQQGEDESQLVVVHGLWILGARGGLSAQPICRDLLGELASSSAAPDGVDCPVPSGGDDPADRLVRDAVRRPPLYGGREGVLDRVLGERDVTEQADQRRDGRAVRLAECAFDVVHPPLPQWAGASWRRPVARKGRTSMSWLIASTTFSAHASA
jgi:hypothetical protein